MSPSLSGAEELLGAGRSLEDRASTAPAQRSKASEVSPELPSDYLDLYKLAVEMADRLSARRGIANSFFLTVNTAVVALVGSQDARWVLGAAGIVFSAAWWALLTSYRDLSTAKFEVILDMERRLPVSVYGDEWDRLRTRRASTPRRWHRMSVITFREIGGIERIVPWLFALIYVTEMARKLIQ